jgi:hypothetical protein
MQHPQRKKSGAPLQETYLSPLYLHALSPLATHLNRSAPPNATRFTESGLASLVYQFVAVLDKFFGKTGTLRHAMTKFPASILNDFTINGSVHIILEAILAAPSGFLERALQAAPGSVVQDLIPFISQLENRLFDKNFIHYPKVFFGPSVPSTVVAELRSIVSKHKGEVVKNEKAATHIIEW